jgi:hypothetical protein
MPYLLEKLDSTTLGHVIKLQQKTITAKGHFLRFYGGLRSAVWCVDRTELLELLWLSANMSCSFTLESQLAQNAKLVLIKLT